MTREETIKILQFIRAAYPNSKVVDAKALADVWFMTLYEYDTGYVYKAARFHVKTSKFFPTPADIVSKLTRGKLAYETPPTPPKLTGLSKINEDECGKCCLYYELDLCGGTKEEARLCHI